jgi:site-specific DNA recombinase
MFRGYIKERNVPEIRKFIGSYIEKVIVYKDHVEVVFFFCVGKDGAGQLRFAAKLSRDRLNDGKVA